ncbi:PepSY domain-containing protein [Rhodospira trueperi]|uniref:Peptidase propeptide and YPEB domain-containing protein n=1 Tax=Rhodospira trueperi TaxID=69960 RepID=A0A1G6XLU9_9PROT|nr:PepSY domain-containing protein [Rhodospira trueperi]SDD78415.1 hypothetical protein SAMN05421720_101530 [Rhodospira trueperi]
MGVWDAVTRFVFRDLPWPKTRLSADQAVEIAWAKARDPDLAAFRGFSGMMAEPRRENGRVVWSVSTATKGSGYAVMIDDATGTVISEGGWGVR